MLTLRNHWTWLLLALALGTAYALVLRQAGLAHGADSLIAPNDSAYIYHQYARSAGQGPAFHYEDGAQPSSGISSILYLYLLSALQGLAPSLAWVGWLIAVASLGLSLLGLRRLGQALSPELGLWLFPALGATQGILVAASFDGVETGLFLAMLIQAIAAWVSRPRSGVIWAWLMALAWCRPEGQIIAGLLGLAVLRKQTEGRVTGTMLWALAALGPSLLWLGINGHIFPDGMRAQSAWLLGPGLALLAVAAAGLGIAKLKPRRPNLALGLLLAWMLLGVLHQLKLMNRAYANAADFQATSGRVARWLAQHRGMGSRLAVVKPGIFAYESGWPITDLAGITDHSIALIAHQGRGAVLEHLLSLPQEDRPSHAVLWPRPDYDPAPLQELGLLQAVTNGPKHLYQWKWDHFDQQGLFYPFLWSTRQILAELNVGAIASEQAGGPEAYSFQGSRGTIFGRFVAEKISPLEGGRMVTREAWRWGHAAPEHTRMIGRIRLAQPCRIWAKAGNTAQGIDLPSSRVGYYTEFSLPIEAGSTEVVIEAFKPGTREPIEYASFHWWLAQIPNSK